MKKTVIDTLLKYRNFEDGLLISFKYFYENNMLNASILFYAKDHLSQENTWCNVEIIMRDVTEIFNKVSGNQFNSLFYGARLYELDKLLCLDIDGNHELNSKLVTIEDIRKFGECYVVGRNIEIREHNC